MLLRLLSVSACRHATQPSSPPAAFEGKRAREQGSWHPGGASEVVFVLLGHMSI